MYMYNIGDIVRIRKDSRYYGNIEDYYNPKDVDGEIIDTNYSSPNKYRVRWTNEKTNCYSSYHLELVTPKQTINNNYKLY